MAEDASEVLVCRFDATDEDIAATRALVKGIEVDIETALEGLRDQDAIKKNYKTGIWSARRAWGPSRMRSWPASRRADEVMPCCNIRYFYEGITYPSSARASLRVS